MITTRRRLAGALLVPLLAISAAACTDSDDDAATTGTEAGTDTAPPTTGGGSEVEACATSEAPDDAGATTTAAEEVPEAAAEFEFRALDAGGPLTKAALEAGDIDVGLLFSSDGAIAANEWVALEDDKDLQPADNFAPAIRSEVCTDDVAAVLDAVSGALTVEAMQEMVASIAIDGEGPETVAETWLEENGPSDLTAEGSITVGSSNFAESSVTAQIYGQALAAAGVDVDYKEDIGARDVYFAALESGEVDLVPEFIGTLLAFLDAEAEPSPDRDVTLAAVREAAAPRGISILEPSEADSVNTFVVTTETAERLDLATVSDLAGVDEALVLGGPPECPERPYCLQGLEGTYGLKFSS